MLAEAGEKADTQTGFSEGDVPPCTGPGPPIPPPADPQNRRKEGPGTGRGQKPGPLHATATYAHSETPKGPHRPWPVNTQRCAHVHWTHRCRPSCIMNSMSLRTHTHKYSAHQKKQASPAGQGPLTRETKIWFSSSHRALSSRYHVKPGPSPMNPHDTINLPSPPPWAHPQSQSQSPAYSCFFALTQAEQGQGLVSRTAWPLRPRATEDWAPGLKAGEETEWPPAGPDQTRSQPPALVTQPHSGRLHMTCRGRERRDPVQRGRSGQRYCTRQPQSDSLLTCVRLRQRHSPGLPARDMWCKQQPHLYTQHVPGGEPLGQETFSSISQRNVQGGKLGGCTSPRPESRIEGPPRKPGIKGRPLLPLWPRLCHSVRGLVG